MCYTIIGMMEQDCAETQELWSPIKHEGTWKNMDRQKSLCKSLGCHQNRFMVIYMCVDMCVCSPLLTKLICIQKL